MKNIAILSIIGFLGCLGCEKEVPFSDVKRVNLKLETNENGRTTEQENVARRLLEDNKPGAIKHLYVISSETGKVLIYSTVKGKPTSSGKRLTPSTIEVRPGLAETEYDGFSVVVHNLEKTTAEVLQNDGTYGPSIEYLFWWDVQDRYHQHYISGGQIVHVTDQPMAVPVNEILIKMSE